MTPMPSPQARGGACDATQQTNHGSTETRNFSVVMFRASVFCGLSVGFATGWQAKEGRASSL